ncbi:hypothetical protein [Geopsychrobacter electrodiphilus]|uniref:hypothetical protein n=1 Tax=Geopsychrobacter electrodiphilus TaxID=225196 RepID=UPI0003713063|nr:hypothetical protein [Geopsychrobacter electrodiphilus]
MEKLKGKDHEIVFFIDKEKFKTDKIELSVREILHDFAKEDPDETTLALRKGNDRQKFPDLNVLISLTNGMKFIVFHNGPTTVSNGDVTYGPERLRKDLLDLGHCVEEVKSNGITYVVIPGYEVEMGRFQGHIIDLGIPSTPDFPRTAAPSIHVKTNPQLLDKKDSIPGVRNITDSPLGPEWRYWSRNFGWNGTEKSARRLMNQIKGVFANV